MKKRAKKNNKSWIIAIIVFLAATVVAISGTTIYRSVQHDRNVRNAHIDQLRFSEADTKQQQVFDRLVNSIGMPLQTEEKDICYNSEQGPFDNGRLWCQVASAAYFSNAIDNTKIKSYFADALASSGLSPKTPGEAWFDGAENLICRLDISNGAFAKSTPYFFSDNPNSEQTIVVYCIDRAEAKHYPYID